MTPEERKQRAREAFWDGSCAHLQGSECTIGIESAIETATRVKVTPEIAAAANAPAPMHDDGSARAGAILRVAGFEVVGDDAPI